MAKTKKQYVVEVTQQLIDSGRPILMSHKMNGRIVKLILDRPDVLGKLSTLLYRSKMYRKGAKGLKASKQLKIFGYTSQRNFIKQSAADVAKFQKILGPNTEFSLSNNALVFVLLKDEATGDTENDIADMKSIAIPYEKALDPTNKIPGARYIAVMWSPEFIRPKDEKFAEVKFNMNNRKEAKRTPAKLKAELKRKHKAKLKRINKSIKDLQKKSASVDGELENYEHLGNTLGIKKLSNRTLKSAVTRYNNKFDAQLDKFSPQELQIIRSARNTWKSGSLKGMDRQLQQVFGGDPQRYQVARNLAINGLQATDHLQKDLGKIQLQQKINKIRQRNKVLQQRIVSAKTSKDAANARFAIRRNQQKISVLKDKFSVGAINYDMALETKQRYNSKLQEARAKRQALQAKLAQIDNDIETIQQLPRTQQVIGSQQVVVPQYDVKWKNKIDRILGRNQQYRKRAQNATTSKQRANANYLIRKNNQRLRELQYVPGKYDDRTDFISQYKPTAQKNAASVQVQNMVDNGGKPQSNPRIEKLMNRLNVLKQRVQTAQNSKVRGNANFQIRKINAKLQQLGVPASAISSQTVPQQMKNVSSQTASGKNMKARIDRLLARNQVLKQRAATAQNSKVRGNANFQIRKNNRKLQQLGFSELQVQEINQVPVQQRRQVKTASAGTGFSLRNRVDSILNRLS